MRYCFEMIQSTKTWAIVRPKSSFPNGRSVAFSSRSRQGGFKIRISVAFVAQCRERVKQDLALHRGEDPERRS